MKPHPLFDSDWYLQQNPDVAASGMNPLQHYMLHGWREGRDPNPLFSISFYLEKNPDVAQAGVNPLSHYSSDGWKEGRSPHPEFDLPWYLERNRDVQEAGTEPLAHYLTNGIHEGRQRHPDIEAELPVEETRSSVVAAAQESDPSQPQSPASLLNHYHTKFSNKGPDFEELDPTILDGRISDVKLLAFYLPQFHATPENDKFWGKGFTEWRQIPRGLPRFPDHYQPRIPRDLGFYDLSDINVMSRQIDMAKTAGIYGFGFYYYWFNGQRVLHKPVEQFLGAQHLSMPFFIIWANENWTKTWDGMNSNVLLHQDYRQEDERALLADIARHFRDGRYINIGGRPLFVIYRPSDVPEPKETFERWREIWRNDFGVNPLIFMAQTFGYTDPLPFGLDGALEFPPHKLTQHLHGRPTPDAFDPSFTGRVISYDDFVQASLSEPASSPFPLIKTAVPSWDNDARRPMRGLTLEHCSPKKYEAWLGQLVARTEKERCYGERLIAINAWNEWAEGAYLEPDVHFGAAYLNATARVLRSAGLNSQPPLLSRRRTNRISAIVPNYNHAQYLERRLSSITSQTRKPDEIIFLDDHSSDDSLALAEKILSKSSIPYSILKNENNSGNVFSQWIKGLDQATGNLIWIAESDDDARPEFLDRMEQLFEQDDVLIGFSKTRYINSDGTPNNDLDHYYSDCGDIGWSSSWSMPTYKAMTGAFATKNLIPNVSAVLFSKPLLTIHERERLSSYTFAGDWYFYALAGRGGRISYRQDIESYFRKSPAGVSQKTIGSERHLQDHRMILEDIGALYGMSTATKNAHLDALSKVIGADISTRIPSLSPESEKKTFRICIAAHSFDVGGGELQPIEIANTLRSLSHHVTYMVLNLPADGSSGRLRSRLRSDIPVIRFEDATRDFGKFIADYGIEIFNSHNVSIEWHLHKKGINIPIPFLASLHGGYETVPHLLSDEFISYVRKNIDTWFFLSEKNIEPLIARGARDANFIRAHNAISIAPHVSLSKASARRQHNIPTDAFVLVLASRAIREKGWQTAIDATTNVRASTGRDCILLLLGDGPDLSTIKKQNADKDYVRFLGHVEQPQQLIGLSDLGIFPSTFIGETFPLFVLECLQNSVPVVATDVGAIKEMLSIANGSIAGAVLAASGDTESLVRLLSTTTARAINEEQILAQWTDIAKLAARNFTIESLTEKYTHEFSALLRKAAGRPR